MLNFFFSEMLRDIIKWVDVICIYICVLEFVFVIYKFRVVIVYFVGKIKCVGKIFFVFLFVCVIRFKVLLLIDIF